ncbi:MAG: hypothetical protein NTV22_11370 [bacterium]|nr:hypothetical protein [bacterium]
MSNFPNPLFGTHVLFTPRGSSVEYYLGHVCAQQDTARWNAAYEFPGDGMPVTGSNYQHFVQGAGVKVGMDFELCLPPSEIGDITGTLVNIGSTTVMLVETYEPASVMVALTGKLIRFKGLRETRVVAAAPAQTRDGMADYTGTWFWYVEVDRAIDMYNGAEIGISYYEYEYTSGWVMWWMNERMAPLVENGWRGTLRIVKGNRDADAGTITQTTIEDTWTALVKAARPKEPVIASAGLVWKLTLSISDYNEEDEDAMTVEASDRTYTDAIVVTWEDVAYAARYQVYVTPTATAPALSEQQTLTNGVWKAANMATVHSVGGLLMEIAGADWIFGSEFLKALGIVDGAIKSAYGYINDKLVPGDGLSAWAAAYVASGASELSAAAHGVTKAA